MRRPLVRHDGRVTSEATAPAALRALQDAATMWALGCEGSAPVVLAAADALAAGFDTPALREFAGLPLDLSWWTAHDLLLAMFSELRLAFPDPEAPSTKLRGLRIMCERLLTGGLSAEDLTAWAHSVIGHDSGDDQAEELVVLEDTDDYMPERPEGWAARVREAAQELVAQH